MNLFLWSNCQNQYQLTRQIRLSLTFKKIEEIIHMYEETSENADERFQLIYAEAVPLTNRYDAEEK